MQIVFAVYEKSNTNAANLSGLELTHRHLIV